MARSEEGRVCLAIFPSEPGGEASVNVCKQIREGNEQSLESSNACCGQVAEPPLGFLSAKPSLHVTVSLGDLGRETRSGFFSPVLKLSPAPWLASYSIHPVLLTCLGEQQAGPFPLVDGLASSGAGLAPGRIGGVGQNGWALPHRLPLAGQAPHSVHSVDPWAAVPLPAQAPGALILGHWALLPGLLLS